MQGVLPPARTVGAEVTPETALSMSAVYRAVTILTTTVSQLEVGVWRKNEEVSPSPSVVSKPDYNTSLSGFLKRTVMSMALNGNAYWRLYRSEANGPVVNIEVLNPNLISIDYDNQNRIVYRYYGYRDGKERTFGINDIKHLRLMELPGADYAIGPIQACRAELTGSLDLRDYSTNWFAKGAIPTGVLSSQDYMDAETAAEYRRRWEENQANRGVAVIGNGMQYQPILLAPADAQFLENQQFSVTQIARLFGIPANYLLAAVEGSSMTYTNMEQVDTAFIKYTVQQYLTEIETALTELLPRGQRARFKVAALLRPDHKTRAEIHKTYHDMGVLSDQEVRDAEGFGPMPPGLEHKHTFEPALQEPATNNKGVNDE